MATRPTDDDVDSLMHMLKLTPETGAIGIGLRCFIVYIWANVPRPKVAAWRGRPVRYQIGGGMPRTFAVSA